MKKSNSPRNDRLLKEKRHDTYRTIGKIADSSSCSVCGALYRNGRWTWENGHELKNTTVCPACKRIEDNYPAGFLEMRGDFFQGHHEEILNLVRNTESLEKEQRPLERIMSILIGKEKTLVTTTGVHVARRIGKALAGSYKGELNVQHPQDEHTVRILWQR